LLDEINQALPAARLSLKDVMRAFTGLLPSADGHDTAISRHDRIIDHEKDGSISGLISVIGVKYTTARSLASSVIDITLSKLGTEGRPGGPESITDLAGRDLEKYIREAESSTTDSGVDADTVRELIHLYGAEYDKILAIMDEGPEWAETISSRPLLIGAQIAYAIREEMALKLSDVVLRRTELGMFGMPESGTLRHCAELMGRELGWDSTVIEEEISNVESEYNIGD
jgi:glycerol-3-phosphate dehydrogenase